MNKDQARNASLPVKHNLTLIYALSFIIAILMAAASVAGLLCQISHSYPMTLPISLSDCQCCLPRCG